MNVKTIFIVISQGVPARNILRTNVFKILQSQSNLRIVIFLPDDRPPHWTGFDFPNVIFEKMTQRHFGIFRRKIFDPLLVTSLNTESAYINVKFGTRKVKPKLSYLVFWLIWAKFLGRSLSVKRLFRFLEMRLYPDRHYAHFFDKYNPDLVFTTSILAKIELPMLKEARRRGVKTISMPKSWDTFDKRLFRVKPDKLIVQNEGLKELAAKEQDFEADKIFVLGFPQFDIYFNPNIIAPRDKFLGDIGLDPAKKLIFFGSGGMFGPSFLDIEFGKLLSDFANSESISEPCSLIIRTHFGDLEPERLRVFRGTSNVYVDDHHQRSNIFGELGDPSYEDMVHLANLLYHSDITINPGSTLSLDAACFLKPIIVTAYGCDILKNSIHLAYYKRVLDTGGVKLATNDDELKEAINYYLKNPKADETGRKVLREKICANPDGRAAERIAEFLLTELGFNKN